MSVDLNKRFSRALVSQGLSSFAQSAITIALMPLVIKLAGPATYGSYVVLNSLILLVTVFCSLGAGFKCRRLLPSAPDASARAALFVPNASFQFLTYLLAAIVLVAAIPLLDRFAFHGEISLPSITIVAAVLSLYVNTLADDYLRYSHQIPLLSRAIVVRSCVQPAFVLLLPVLGLPLNANSLISAQIVAYAIVALPLWWSIGREIQLRFRLNPWAVHREDISLGFPLVTAVVVENLLSAVDRYILAAYLTATSVGAYAAAFTVGSLVLLLPRIANSVLLPSLSQAVDSGRAAEAHRLLGNFLQVFLMLALPFIAGSALLGAPLLAWLASPEVAELGRWVVPIAAIGGTFYGCSYLIFNALFINGQTGRWFAANATATVLVVVLNLFLVGWLRRIEVAAVVSVIGFATSWALVRRGATGWHLPFDRVEFGRSLLATATMVASLAGLRFLPYFQSTDLPTLGGLVLIGVLLYFGTLVLAGGYRPRRFLVALGLLS